MYSSIKHNRRCTIHYRPMFTSVLMPVHIHPHTRIYSNTLNLIVIRWGKQLMNTPWPVWHLIIFKIITIFLSLFRYYSLNISYSFLRRNVCGIVSINNCNIINIICNNKMPACRINYTYIVTFIFNNIFFIKTTVKLINIKNSINVTATKIRINIMKSFKSAKKVSLYTKLWKMFNNIRSNMNTTAYSTDSLSEIPARLVNIIKILPDFIKNYSGLTDE